MHYHGECKLGHLPQRTIVTGLSILQRHILFEEVILFLKICVYRKNDKVQSHPLQQHMQHQKPSLSKIGTMEHLFMCEKNKYVFCILIEKVLQDQLKSEESKV